MHITTKKRPGCWERLRARGEGGDRGWDAWMASWTQWIWVWANSLEIVKGRDIVHGVTNRWLRLSDWTAITAKTLWPHPPKEFLMVAEKDFHFLWLCFLTLLYKVFLGFSYSPENWEAYSFFDSTGVTLTFVKHSFTYIVSRNKII